jgi:hypothetical protein
MKSINQLNKRELVDICKRITGNGGDYARTSIDTYRDRVKTLRKARQDDVDTILAEMTGDVRLDKDARIKQLEDALRYALMIADKPNLSIVERQTYERCRAALGDDS